MLLLIDFVVNSWEIWSTYLVFRESTKRQMKLNGIIISMIILRWNKVSKPYFEKRRGDKLEVQFHITNTLLAHL